MKQYDSQEKRCPILGHQVQFSYCRQCEVGKPCPRILNCWSDSIPIHTYISTVFGAEEMKRLTTPPPNKMCTIVDLINKIKKE